MHYSFINHKWGSRTQSDSPTDSTFKCTAHNALHCKCTTAESFRLKHYMIFKSYCTLHLLIYMHIIFVFCHQNTHLCSFPALGLERDPMCYRDCGGATVHVHGRDWSRALSLKQQILSDFLCPPFLVQPGRREGNGSFLCESPELPQPAPYHLSLTYCAQTRLRELCFSLSLSSSSTFLFVFM